MFLKTLKQNLQPAALTVLLMMASLWSWNILADLFDVPQAQFKHIVAAMILLAGSRWILNPLRGKRSPTRHVHEH